MRKGSFKLQNGTEISIQGVSPLLARQVMARVEADMRAEGKPLDVPQYAVTTVTGEKLWYDHNLTTLYVEGNPEETEANRALWRAHQDALLEQDTRSSEAMIEMFVIAGVAEKDLPEMPADDGWIRKRKILGLKTPEDADARYRLWLTTCWLEDLEAFRGLTSQIRELSYTGADWERVERIEETFPGPVQGPAAEAGTEE